MILIVGLGNPGKKYAKTRHNIGFRVIDALKEKISGQDIVFLKPETFMNESGKAVKQALAYYKIPAENLYVIHDEIDLPFGEIRVSKDSSSAGHKGVQSIIDELKTQDFTRIRIGIEQTTRPQKQETSDFVLEKFSKQEERELGSITKRAIEEINALLSSRP